MQNAVKLRFLTGILLLTCLLAPSASSGQAPGTFRLTVATSGSGTVESLPAGILCGNSGTACTADFPAGTTVRLEAFEASEHRFSHWTGDCVGGEFRCPVAMNSDRNVTAWFVGAPRTTIPQSAFLSVSLRGKGTVKSMPVGINCGKLCFAAYTHTGEGISVTLTARPGFRYRFGGWSGDCAGRRLICTLRVARAHDVRARFIGPPVMLCHRGRTITVPASQVSAHRRHGDRLGRCRKR